MINIDNSKKKFNDDTKNYVVVTNKVGGEIDLKYFNAKNKSIHTMQFVELVENLINTIILNIII